MRTCLIAAAVVATTAAAVAEPVGTTTLPPNAYAALSAAGYTIVADPRSDATIYTFYCARPVACREPDLDRGQIPGPYQFLNEPYAAGNDRTTRRRRA